MSRKSRKRAAKREALKTLYDGHQAAIKSRSERSFTTTLQTIALDAGIVAAIIAASREQPLSSSAKGVAIVFVAVLTIVVTTYLSSKAVSHHRQRMRIHEIETLIADFARVSRPLKPSLCWSFCLGSLLFVALILFAGIASAVWIATQS
jgi:hypothetical protein